MIGSDEEIPATGSDFVGSALHWIFAGCDNPAIEPAVAVRDVLVTGRLGHRDATDDLLLRGSPPECAGSYGRPRRLSGQGEWWHLDAVRFVSCNGCPP